MLIKKYEIYYRYNDSISYHSFKNPNILFDTKEECLDVIKEWRIRNNKFQMVFEIKEVYAESI